jgi:hypothetical protein
VLHTRKGGARFMNVDADTGAREWAVAQQSQKRRGWPSVDVELTTGEWRHVGRTDLRLFPTAADFLAALGVWITSNDYLDATDNGRGVAAESATLDWGKMATNTGSALKRAT